MNRYYNKVSLKSTIIPTKKKTFVGEKINFENQSRKKIYID